MSAAFAVFYPTFLNSGKKMHAVCFENLILQVFESIYMYREKSIGKMPKIRYYFLPFEKTACPYHFLIN